MPNAGSRDGATVLQVYLCPVCLGYYVVGTRFVACRLHHPPGSCCHSGDRPLSRRTVNHLLQLVGGQQADRERGSVLLREP